MKLPDDLLGCSSWDHFVKAKLHFASQMVSIPLWLPWPTESERRFFYSLGTLGKTSKRTADTQPFFLTSVPDVSGLHMEPLSANCLSAFSYPHSADRLLQPQTDQYSARVAEGIPFFMIKYCLSVEKMVEYFIDQKIIFGS